MPQEQIYGSQLGPREATPRPLVSPAALGAQVGEALQQAGGMVHEQELRAYAIERKAVANQELASAERAFAEHRRAMGDQVRGLRESAGPGGAGHSEAVDQANDAGRQAVLDNISDPEVARHMRDQWGQWSDGLHGQEAGWQQGKRIERLIDDTGETNNQSANIVRAGGGDKDIYTRELGTRQKAIAMLHVDEDTREKLYRDAENSAAVGYLLGLRDTDPVAAEAAIASGGFNFLPAPTLDQLGNGNAVEIRRIEGEQEHLKRLAAAQGKDAIATLEKLFDQGVKIPDSDFVAAIALAKSMGDQSKVADLEGKRADNRFAGVWSGQSAIIRQNRVATLQNKRQRTADEDRELNWLTGHREALDSREKSDPVGFAIENAPPGTGPPAGDVIGDPAAMQARAQWYRTNKTVYGGDAFYTKAEVERLDAERDQGPQGMQRVLGAIDQLPEEVRTVAARQIAPGDGPQDALLRQLVFVNPQTRGVMMAGQQALQANPQLLKPVNVNAENVIAFGQVTIDMKRAMKLRSPADADATQTLAMYYVAGYMHQMGVQSIDQLPPGFVQRAYRQASGGGTNSKGEIVGGPSTWGDRLFVLPSRHTQASFAGALFNDSKARKIRPVNPDGSAFDVKFAVPVFVRIDPQDPDVWLYRFETRDGRVVQSSGGGDYIARIRDR